MCSIIDPIEKYLFEIQVHSQGYIKLSGYVMSKFYQLSFKEQYRNSKLSTYNIIIFKIILTSIMEDIVSGYFNTI